MPDFKKILEEIAAQDLKQNTLYISLINDSNFDFVEFYLSPALKKYASTDPVLCIRALNKILDFLDSNNLQHNLILLKIKEISSLYPYIFNSCTKTNTEPESCLHLNANELETLNYGSFEEIFALFMKFKEMLSNKPEEEVKKFYINLLNSIEDQNFRDRFAAKSLFRNKISYLWGKPEIQQCLEFLFYTTSKEAAKRWNKDGENWDNEIREFVMQCRANIQIWLDGVKGDFGLLVGNPGYKCGHFVDHQRWGDYQHKLTEFWIGAFNNQQEGLFVVREGEKSAIPFYQHENCGFAKIVLETLYWVENNPISNLPEEINDWNKIEIDEGFINQKIEDPRSFNGTYLVFYSKADPKRGLKPVALYSFYIRNSQIDYIHPRYSSIAQIRPYQKRLADEIGLFPDDGDLKTLLELIAKYYYYGAQCPIVYRGGAACNDMEFVAMCLSKGYLPPTLPLPTPSNPKPSMDLEAITRTEEDFVEFFLNSIEERGGLRKIRCR